MYYDEIGLCGYNMLLVVGSIVILIGRAYVVTWKDDLHFHLPWHLHLNSNFELEMTIYVIRNP